MSIFSSIKDAIFGHEAKVAAPAAAPPKPAAASGIPANPANANWAPPPAAPVDVENVLTELAAKNPQKLNWRASIVDLMKLLGIDSSFANRKSLAQELGFTGDANDSASMNVWLHKRVMQELEKNGGKVPASLTS